MKLRIICRFESFIVFHLEDCLHFGTKKPKLSPNACQKLHRLSHMSKF